MQGSNSSYIMVSPQALSLIRERGSIQKDQSCEPVAQAKHDAGVSVSFLESEGCSNFAQAAIASRDG